MINIYILWNDGFPIITTNIVLRLWLPDGYLVPTVFARDIFVGKLIRLGTNFLFQLFTRMIYLSMRQYKNKTTFFRLVLLVFLGICARNKLRRYKNKFTRLFFYLVVVCIHHTIPTCFRIPLLLNVVLRKEYGRRRNMYNYRDVVKYVFITQEFLCFRYVAESCKQVRLRKQFKCTFYLT